MFCPNCGEKLKEPIQGFCPTCGSKIPTFSEAPQSRTEKSPYESTARSQSTLEYPDYQVKQQMPAKIGGTGPNSKKCLGFAIASLALAIFALNYGFGFLLLSIIPNLEYTYTRLVIDLIIITVIHIVGLVFGILSKIFSSKAGDSEPENGVEKVGSVLGIFGIIINAISLAIALLVAPLLLLTRMILPWPW